METVEALCSVFYLFSKLGVKEKQFKQIYEESKLDPKYMEPLAKSYQEHKGELKKLLIQTEEDKEIHFKELHWRIDVEIAGKTKSSSVVPKFLLNLMLEKEGKPMGLLLESNYSNLKRVKEELQNAIASLNSPYGRKIARYAK